MPLDSIPQISLGTGALVIFVICVGFVMLRGMMRMMVGTVILGLSSWIGYYVWQMAPALSVDWTGKSLTWITNGLPVAAWLVSFFAIRMIVGTVLGLFQKTAEIFVPRSLGSLATRLLVALVPTTLVCVIGVALVYHAAAVADVRATSGDGVEKNPQLALSQRLRASLNSILPASWIAWLEPLGGSSRLALAKLITAQAKSPEKPLVNPETGKPYPRAIIVADPALQKLAREGKFDTLLRHPLLTKALEDPKIQKLLRDLSP